MRYFDLSAMSMQDIEIFLAIAQHESFTKAARSMFLTQPFLSKRISALEQATGLQLFIRNRQNVRLTPAGRLLRDRWGGMIRTVSSSLDEAHVLQKGLSGSLLIGFLEWGDLFLLSMIKSFREECPDISLNLNQLSFRELRKRFFDGEIDVLFSTTYEIKGFPKNAKHLVLREGNLAAIMSADHPLSTRARIRMDDLKSESFLMLHEGDSPNYNKMIKELCAQHGFLPRVSHYAIDGRAHIMNLMMNEGILLATRYFLGESESHFMKAVPIEGTHAGITVAWLEENPNQAVERLICFLRSKIEKEPIETRGEV